MQDITFNLINLPSSIFILYNKKREEFKHENAQNVIIVIVIVYNNLNMYLAYTERLVHN